MFDYKYKKIANLIRQIRLENPYKEPIKHRMWFEQCQYNIPLLIFGSIELNNVCKEQKYKNLLFSSRDCCLWIQIFDTLYKKYNSIYFNTSRKIYYNATDDYVKYVKSLYNDRSVIIDLHASGKSVSHYFKTHMDTIPNVFFMYHIRSQNYGIISNINVYQVYKYGSPGALNGRHARIEVLNYDTIGTLISYEGNKPIRAPIEYNLQTVRDGYHKCIEYCCKIINDYYINYDTINHDLMKEINETMNKNKACSDIG